MEYGIWFDSNKPSSFITSTFNNKYYRLILLLLLVLFVPQNAERHILVSEAANCLEGNTNLLKPK